MTPLEGVTIEWADNPLATKVILTDAAKREFVLRNIIQWMLDEDCSKLDEDVEDPIQALAIQTHAHAYLEALEGTHVGDCTRAPSTCTKCVAEAVAGINTVKGLHAYEAAKIQGVFGPGMKIEEAIEKLGQPFASDYSDRPAYHQLMVESRERALAWLEAYRLEKLCVRDGTCTICVQPILEEQEKTSVPKGFAHRNCYDEALNFVLENHPPRGRGFR